MTMTRRSILGAAGALAVAAPALAQTAWPAARPIRLVVGFPPGGSGDFLARALGEPLGRELGQTVVIDNRPGAGSNIASENVARSEPDGYTVLLGGNFSHAVNPAMYRRIPFDPIADFTPITRLTDLPTIIAVAPQSGITSLAQLLARIRAEPGRWNYATPGNGTPSHLAGAMLAKVAGLELTHVPFRGGAPSLQAVLAGDVQIIIGTPPVVLPQSRAGRLTALSLTTRLPSPVIPEVPGAEAAGLPELDIGGWWGLWGPARLPAPIRARLMEAMLRVMAQPALQEKLATEGLQVTTSASPEEFEAFIRREIPFWAEVVRQAGAVID
ncbi:tripartite tricarboxylate transporter substrate binding protein [Siccirubricoccus sp. G192]|uniref:Bug family tripartite tricarboxylate transporter substrate binding protein n=1 Tax=Siccirubricoccus sp. G192 TaxID=2849651 RepID=UPI001C2C56B8|nr:tripartite tricarboxylate transporter substrate binding protein [Siccirubricoccus sp. G192]MBV1798113.1 tripartite tricarboxylate transporter substrate binding protein [Siccirubricoccus sp. G192]